MAKNSISRKLLEKRFPAEYIKQGMNGRKAYMAIKKTTKNPLVADVQASRLLSKDNIKQSIIDLLPSDSEEVNIIKEAFQAKRESNISWKDLRGYTELSLKLKGHLNNDNNKPSVNVGIVIQK